MAGFFVTKHVSFVIVEAPVVVHVFKSSHGGYNVVVEDPVDAVYDYMSLDEVNDRYKVHLTPDMFEVEAQKDEEAKTA